MSVLREWVREIIGVNVCLYVSVYLHLGIYQYLSVCGCVVHAFICICLSTCVWVYLRECVSMPYAPWPRWLWVIAPYLVACQFISMWLKEGGGGAIYSTYLCPLSLLLMIIMNDLCSTGMCVYVPACHKEKLMCTWVCPADRVSHQWTACVFVLVNVHPLVLG